MQVPLLERWAAFDKMIRQLGAVSLARQHLVRTGPEKARTRVVEALADAVCAVSRFAEDASGSCAADAWAAIDRADEAARDAKSIAGAVRGADDEAQG